MTTLLRRLRQLLRRRTDPPDPATVAPDQVRQVVEERIRLGLKPFPSLPDDHYFNTIRYHCSVCGGAIYGGQAIGYYGWGDIRCEDHFDKR